MVGDTLYDGTWVRVERDWAKYPRYVYEIKVYTSNHYPEGCVDDIFDVEKAQKLRTELSAAITVLKGTLPEWERVMMEEDRDAVSGAPGY
jgi:hypothetical protein